MPSTSEGGSDEPFRSEVRYLRRGDAWMLTSASSCRAVVNVARNPCRSSVDTECLATGQFIRNPSFTAKPANDGFVSASTSLELAALALRLYRWSNAGVAQSDQAFQRHR